MAKNKLTGGNKEMKKIIFFLVLLFSMQPVFAQFNDNDYTNMLEFGTSGTNGNDFSLDVSYSWIYYMGPWGNLAIRPEVQIWDSVIEPTVDLGVALLYGYDFGRSFHVFPYAGISANWLSGYAAYDLYQDYLEWNFTANAVFGAKIFFEQFGIYGEYKYNLLKNDDSRLSLGFTFAFGDSYIPQPPAPRPAPRPTPTPAPEPEPQPQFVYHPTISSEELTKVELSYQSTISDIERQGRRIYIDSYPARNTFIQRYQGRPDITAVSNAKNAKLPYYYYNSTSERQIVAMAQSEPNKFMKVRIIHDWVADIFAYDHDYLEWMRYSNRNHIYTLGEIVERERGVCLEYAILFYNLAMAAGIDTYLISDHSKPGIGHAYNMVVIDRVGYIIDTTWDSGNQVKYNRSISDKKMVSKDYFMPSISQSYRLRGW
ncbi:hypothetical protein FACS189483_04110 [Spirochaetia bacterium]|nr:hypothetical protein FACS189483_04110 [Spirochaetia bacterium]